MMGVFLLGMGTTLLLLGLAWLGVRGWQRAFPPPPPQPQTPAQKANEEAYDFYMSQHPQVVSMRLQRRARHRPESEGSWHAHRENR